MIEFPDPETADEDGLLAVGGNLEPEMLISAYSQGIFPWYDERTPILWWSPNPRMVLFPDQFHCSRRLCVNPHGAVHGTRISMPSSALVRSPARRATVPGYCRR